MEFNCPPNPFPRVLIDQSILKIRVRTLLKLYDTYIADVDANTPALLKMCRFIKYTCDHIMDEECLLDKNTQEKTITALNEAIAYAVCGTGTDEFQKGREVLMAITLCLGKNVTPGHIR